MIDIENPDAIKKAEDLALLADDFRAGRRRFSDLLDLLNSVDDNIVMTGAWIAGEINIGSADAGPVILRLKQLVKHASAQIRFYAIGALCPFLDKSDPGAVEMLTVLSGDSNAGVRMITRATLRTLGIEIGES